MDGEPVNIDDYSLWVRCEEKEGDRQCVLVDAHLNRGVPHDYGDV